MVGTTIFMVWWIRLEFTIRGRRAKQERALFLLRLFLRDSGHGLQLLQHGGGMAGKVSTLSSCIGPPAYSGHTGDSSLGGKWHWGCSLSQCSRGSFRQVYASQSEKERKMWAPTTHGSWLIDCGLMQAPCWDFQKKRGVFEVLYWTYVEFKVTGCVRALCVCVCV